MKVSDFYFDLPQELIAQKPLERRDLSRLMLIKKGKTIEDGVNFDHVIFKDLVDYLNKGDVLVLNNTRVLPARLLGEKKTSGGNIEFLLLKRIDKDCWEALAKPGKSAKVGREFTFGKGLLDCEVIEVKEDGNRIIKFKYEGIFEEILDRLGEMPLPPYIHEKLKDKERYQTVYSKEEGSAAAPTAGLHFTEELLAKIKAKGVNIAYLTLHVGLGTFRPVKVESIDGHHMHSEYYEIDEENAKIIMDAKMNNKRVISVGTTSTRTLETIARDNFGKIVKSSGWTDIFIYPGFNFKIVDCLITNFHLPESTLIMLVAAFMGYENTMEAYKLAVQEKYRFFSFGDSMFIYMDKDGKENNGKNN